MNKKLNALQKNRQRRANRTSRTLNITSLLDIMTILLVFMIKNVSMDVSQRNAPEGMRLPLSITKEQLLKNSQIVSVKIYPDKVLFGPDNMKIGTPDELLTDKKLQKVLIKFLKKESSAIKKNGGEPGLLIQGDRRVKCKYITGIIRISTRASFANIYFSTIKADNKKQLLSS